MDSTDGKTILKKKRVPGKMIFFQTLSDKVIEYVGYISDEEAQILENNQPLLLDDDQTVRIRRILDRL